LSTFQLNGRNLEGLADASFDLVATYSVLHHIPDYLSAIREMARVLRPGGVLYLDHERNEEYWQASPVYQAYRATVTVPREPLWRKMWRFDLYRDKVRVLFDPRYQGEGDIHVWPDDHIEWPRVEALLQEEGLEVMVSQDFLLFERGADPAAWEAYRSRCTDTRVVMARRQLYDR
jgi:SAM-dependent methyltransferase